MKTRVLEMNTRRGRGRVSTGPAARRSIGRTNLLRVFVNACWTGWAPEVDTIVHSDGFTSSGPSKQLDWSIQLDA